MLEFYAGRLRTVEINNSFYHLPAKETFRQWKEHTPADFVFAVKASRYISHMKKLKDPAESVTRFLSQAEELGAKLGPILFQLPPHWGHDAGRLAKFLEALPRHHRYAFECRDPSWFHPEIYARLKQYHAAFCVFDLAATESPRLMTADFAYVRLHGPAAQKYAGLLYPQPVVRLAPLGKRLACPRGAGGLCLLRQRSSSLRCPQRPGTR
jgi:uncharacterized protein YecE (DUF72 family)